jgi:hypothetical protein
LAFAANNAARKTQWRVDNPEIYGYYILKLVGKHKHEKYRFAKSDYRSGHPSGGPFFYA